MNRSLKICAGVALALPFVYCPGAIAQLGVYATIGATKMKSPDGTTFIYGPTIGVSKQFADRNGLRIGADLRGSFEGGGGLRLTQISIGPKISFTRRALTPYIEALAGFGRLSATSGKSQGTSTDSEIQLNSGIDYQLNDHIDLRAIEYSYEQYYGLGGAYNPKRFSTGIVYNFNTRFKTSK